LSGDNKNSGGESDDLLSELLNLKDEEPKKDPNPKENAAAGFTVPTKVPVNDQTEILVKEETDHQEGLTELVSASPSEGGAKEKDKPQSLDDFLGLSDVGENIKSEGPSHSQDDLLDSLFSDQEDQPADTDSKGADSKVDATEAFHPSDSPEDATQLDQQGENPFDQPKVNKTLILDDPIEPLDSQTPSDSGYDVTTGADKELDPIDEALAEYASEQDETSNSSTILESDSAPQDKESSDLKVTDLFDNSFKGQADLEKKELSEEDFADVFKSGPIQVSHESKKTGFLDPKKKKIIGIAAAASVFVGIFGTGLWRFSSEAGLFGYRLDHFSLQAVYEPPDEAFQQQFQKVLKTSWEARDKDNPKEIESSLAQLDSILKKDRRNFESASLHLEMLGILMAWEGVQGKYPQQYDKLLAQIEAMSKKIKKPLNWDTVSRAKAWKSMAAGEYVNTLSNLEKAIKGTDIRNNALMAELAYRAGLDKKAKPLFKKLKPVKLVRAQYFDAVFKNDLSRLKLLAKQSYLPAAVDEEVRIVPERETPKNTMARLKKFSEKVARYPWLSVKVKARLGDLLVSEGRAQEAQKEWKSIVKSFPKESEIWFKLARSYENESEWDQALNAYRSALKSGAENKRIHLEYIQLLRLQMKIVDALDAIDQAISKFPKSPDFYYEKGESQMAIYQEDAAKKSYMQALKLDPNYVPATLSLADLAMKQQDWKGAAKLYAQVSPKSKYYSLALLGLGRLSMAQHQLKTAQKYFALAIKDDPKNEKAYIQLTDLLLRDEQDNKAFALTQQALDLMPRSPYSHMARARVYLFQHKYDEATKEIASYLKTHNHITSLMLLYADLLIDQKDYVKAEKLLQQLNIKGIDEPQINYLLAKAYFLNKDHNSTIIGSQESTWRLIQTASKQNPDNEKYLILQARIALGLDEKLDANLALKHVLRLYPDSSEAHVVLGDLHFINGFNDKAILDYKNALKFTRFKGKIYQKIAQVYSTKGDSKKAVRYYTYVTKWFPSGFSAYLELGKLYNDLGKSALAKRSLQRAIQLKPNVPDAYYYLAYIEKDAGESSSALKDFEHYLQLEPNGVEAATVKDEIYFLKQGSTEN